MARLERVTHKLFAENAPIVESGTNQVEIGQFGSALAGTYVATNDVETLQALPAYTRGWGGAVIPDSNFPTLEDMNAVQRVQSYQTGYLYQEGIPEYDANTTYYEGSVCKIYQDGSTSIATSLINENTGNPLTDTSAWAISPLIAGNVLRYNRITNCLLEVPQNIKLELNNGILTLKAGSKVIVPNGAGVFDYLTLDTSFDTTGSSLAGTGQLVVFYHKTKNRIMARYPHKITSGTTAPTIAYSAWYDTASNKVYDIESDISVRTNILSLPIAIVTVNSEQVITSIDQVFNGIGYIGSTLWVDKGVKGLIPNGRNTDGSLNNIEFKTSQVLTKTFTGSSTVGIYLSAHYIGWFNVANMQYKEAENVNYEISTSNVKTYACCGQFTTTNGVISNFQPNQPFRAVDYSDAVLKSTLSEAHVVTQTYKNGTSWYRVWSDGWIEQGGYQSSSSGSVGLTINFLKSFSNTNYTIVATVTGAERYFVSCLNKTAGSFVWRSYSDGGQGYDRQGNWYACGY